MSSETEETRNSSLFSLLKVISIITVQQKKSLSLMMLVKKSLCAQKLIHGFGPFFSNKHLPKGKTFPLPINLALYIYNAVSLLILTGCSITVYFKTPVRYSG